MIPNQWYVVLDSAEVRQRPVGVTRLGERLVFFRDTRGVVSCLRDACAHRGAALSAGRVVGDCVECPFHGFLYDSTGACRLVPANGRGAALPPSMRVSSYPTREAHGLVWVWYGEPRQEYPPLPFFKDVDETFSYTTIRDHWAVHYSRAIENQLDVVHLPFVHKRTIGRGNRTLVDGPLSVLEVDELRIWVYNRVDDGKPPLKPQELPSPERPPFLLFHFPNLWQNRIGEDTRIVAAFAPVDDGNVVLYVRPYQRTTRLPVLKQVMNAGLWLGSRIILGEDKRVVETQRPKRTTLKMGERLIQGDRPIVVYRQRREALIEKAAGKAAGKE